MVGVVLVLLIVLLIYACLCSASDADEQRDEWKKNEKWKDD